MAQRAIEGRQRRILGITGSGIVIPLIMGAEPNPEDENERPEGESSVEGGEGVQNGEVVEDANAPGKVYTEDDIQAVLRRMQAADKNSSDLQKKLKAYEDKDKSELEKLQAELAESQAKSEAAEKRLLETRIHNEFLASNKHTWHDPKTALKLLDLENVEVDENGKVSGLDKAIEALAKAQPFLVNKDKGGESGQRVGGGRPSGSQPPANTSGKDRDKDRAALLKKYPQLNK